MAVSINCKNNPLSLIWGATGTCRPFGGRQVPVAQAVGDRDRDLSVKIFIFKQIPDGDATAGGVSPVPRATGCMAHELELPWTTHASIMSLAAAAQA